MASAAYRTFKDFHGPTTFLQLLRISLKFKDLSRILKGFSKSRTTSIFGNITFEKFR